MMEQSNDRLWDPLSPVVSQTDMSRPEDFPSDTSLVIDPSFIPNDPVPDVEVLIPNVVPFMCHKDILCSSGLYKCELDRYPQTTVFYPLSIYEPSPLSIIYYLYTNHLTTDPSRDSTSFLEQCLELAQNAYMEHALDDLQQQVEDTLAQFDPNEVSRGMPIKHFIKVVYFYKAGLDSELRRRLVKPYLKEYIEMVIERFNENDPKPFPMKSVARLPGDVLAWQDSENQADNAIVLLRALRGLATTVSPGLAGV